MHYSVSQLNRRPISSGQRGTSLIEVLVVLVILAVGILSIVRLFPAGFIALRNAENSTAADRLAQGALEQLKKSNGALPDAVYMYSDNGSGSFDPNVNSDPNVSDINSERYISNETITIPASRVVNNQPYPPLYVVNYGPIDLPDLTTHGDHLQVNGTPWTSRTGDSRTSPSDPNFNSSIDNPADVLQPGQQTYLVDLAAGNIAVPLSSKDPNKTYAQMFTITVQTANGVQKPVIVTVPSNYTGDWFNTLPGLKGLLAAGPWTSITVYRPFKYLGTVPSDQPFSSDPYEFKVLNANIGGTNTNMGVLAFNQLASGQNGAQALKARISYIALDWHILHEDHDIAPGASTIRLTLNHLKIVGDTQFDQSLFGGLTPGASVPADLMLLDLDTGQYTLLNGQAGTSALGTETAPGKNDPAVTNVDTATSIDTKSYQVSYQNGRLTFPTINSGQHLRIFYAGDVDWAVAVQKAPSVYNLIATGNLATDTGTLKNPGSTPNNYVLDPSGLIVYFPLCDAGKTVEFDGISYQSGNQPRQIGVGTATISTDLDAVYKVPYVNLTGSGMNTASILSDVPTRSTMSFSAVRGISARAVVIWHERNRWRVRTTDTLLTQTQ